MFRWRRHGPWLALAATGAALWGAAAIDYRRDMTAARARLSGQSRVIETPYGQQEFADRGAGQPILMIHGSGGGFDQGLAFSEGLPREAFRIIAPSRFGYLRSDLPVGATPEMQADALAILVRRLNVGRVVIVGGSAGALSATQLALRHPHLCRGLVLLVPAAYAPDRAPETSAVPPPVMRAVIATVLGSDPLFWLAIKTAPDQMTRLILATDPKLLRTAGKAERQRLRAVLYGVLPVSARKRGILLDSTTAGTPTPYAPERLACPLLAISTRDDLYGTDKAARYAAAKAPHARLVLYDTGGHLLVGHDAAAWAEIAAFARNLPP